MEAQTRKLKEDEMRHSKNNSNPKFTSSSYNNRESNFWRNNGTGTTHGGSGRGNHQRGGRDFRGNFYQSGFANNVDSDDDDDDDDDQSNFFKDFHSYTRANSNSQSNSQSNRQSHSRGNPFHNNSNKGNGGHNKKNNNDNDADKEEDNYTLLGVSSNATERDIKSAYRKLALKYHPDKNQGDEAATEMFKKITGAYSILSDKQSRAKYDHTRRYS